MVTIRREEDHRYQISHVLVTVKLSNLFSLLVSVEIFQSNKIELLVSKISGTILFMIVCLFCRFFNSVGLHNLRFPPQRYKLCGQSAVTARIPNTSQMQCSGARSRGNAEVKPGTGYPCHKDLPPPTAIHTRRLWASFFLPVNRSLPASGSLHPPHTQADPGRQTTDHCVTRSETRAGSLTWKSTLTTEIWPEKPG